MVCREVNVELAMTPNPDVERLERADDVNTGSSVTIELGKPPVLEGRLPLPNVDVGNSELMRAVSGPALFVEIAEAKEDD